MKDPEAYGAPETITHEYPAYGLGGEAGTVLGIQYQRRDANTGKSIGSSWWGQPGDEPGAGTGLNKRHVVELGLAGSELLPADLAGIKVVLGEGPNFARVVGEALEPPYRAVGTWGAPHRPADEALGRLVGADAVLLALDCDDPSTKQQTEIGSRLATMGVKVLVVPFADGAREHDDLVDYLRADGDLHKLLGQAVPFADSELCEPVATLAAIPDFPLGSLPVQAREMVEHGLAAYGTPITLTAGACMAALAAAIGPNATITTPSWFRGEKAILWIPLIAPAGVGKRAAQQMGLDQIRYHDRNKMPGYKTACEAWRVLPYNSRGAPPPNPKLLMNDTTLEALSDRLAAMGGAGCLDLDELGQLMKGLGQYKHGGGDMYKLCELWSGTPWSVDRVGVGRTVYIAEPQLVMVGGMTPEGHAMLGDPASGQRPRFLPHLAALPRAARRGNACQQPPSDWNALVNTLLNCRQRTRTWSVDGEAGLTFEGHRERWAGQSLSGNESPSTASALRKADTHLLRAILVLAEGSWPGQTRAIPVELVDRAADWIDFTLDCWRALPEADDGLALSFRDKFTGPRVDALLSYLERVGEPRTRRQLQQARLVKTGTELDAVIEAYGDQYQGCVWTSQSEHGWRPTVWVKAPERRPGWGGKRPGAGRPRANQVTQQVNGSGGFGAPVDSTTGSEKRTRDLRSERAQNTPIVDSTNIHLEYVSPVESFPVSVDSTGGENPISAPLGVHNFTPAEARDRLRNSASAEELAARRLELKPVVADWPRAILDGLNQVCETRLEQLKETA